MTLTIGNWSRRYESGYMGILEAMDFNHIRGEIPPLIGGAVFSFLTPPCCLVVALHSQPRPQRQAYKEHGVRSARALAAVCYTTDGCGWGRPLTVRILRRSSTPGSARLGLVCQLRQMLCTAN